MIIEKTETGLTWKEKAGLTDEDIEVLQGQYHISEQTIRALIEGGVLAGQLQDILDLRQRLSDAETGFCETVPAEKMTVPDAVVSNEALTAAFKAVGGDLDVLAELVELAREKASDVRARIRGNLSAAQQRRLRARFTIALNEVLAEYGERRNALLEEI